MFTTRSCYKEKLLCIHLYIYEKKSAVNIKIRIIYYIIYMYNMFIIFIYTLIKAWLVNDFFLTQSS